MTPIRKDIDMSKAKSQNTLFCSKRRNLASLMQGRAEQVEKIADNLENTLLCTFFFVGQIF